MCVYIYIHPTHRSGQKAEKRKLEKAANPVPKAKAKAKAKAKSLPAPVASELPAEWPEEDDDDDMVSAEHLSDGIDDDLDGEEVSSD